VVVPKIEIIASRDGVEIARFTVKPGDYVIGREPPCDLVIDDDVISRHHAKLTINYDEIYVTDLGSANGTFINGRPVEGDLRIWPNQTVFLGSIGLSMRRLKVQVDPNDSFSPQVAVVRKLLPEEILREKKYEIGGVVAQGAMGAILDAVEVATQRTVAMKVMLTNISEEDLMRFIQEAQIIGQLEHPNIVPLHELGVDENDQVFYTMKMVKGITLGRILELLARREVSDPAAADHPAAGVRRDCVCALEGGAASRPEAGQCDGGWIRRGAGDGLGPSEGDGPAGKAES
jgi:eukaryotic-like serine/threonine-protein kinase